MVLLPLAYEVTLFLFFIHLILLRHLRNHVTVDLPAVR